ncbi:hypothetical protein BD770DRAFT_403299 [Pilaira anomala]|nr:hypothetical protein BD770DRAFT_403299 [Pilaira anomala]
MGDDQAVFCPNQECRASRYKTGTTSPRAQMACVSIGKSLTQMLLDDDTRELFKYKNNFDFNNEQLVDIFSGENYKHLRDEKIVGDNDICIVMYVDGFQNKHKPDSSQTMIHSIIMNLDPSI